MLQPWKVRILHHVSRIFVCKFSWYFNVTFITLHIRYPEETLLIDLSNCANKTTRCLLFKFELTDLNLRTIMIPDDILVFTMERTVEFNNYIRPACLWNGNTDLNRIVGASGVVSTYPTFQCAIQRSFFWVYNNMCLYSMTYC